MTNVKVIITDNCCKNHSQNSFSLSSPICALLTLKGSAKFNDTYDE